MLEVDILGMLDIKFLRENPEKVKRGIESKRAPAKLVDDFLAVDKDWREAVKNIDDLRAKQKKAGAAFAKGEPRFEGREARNIELAKELKEKIKNLEDGLAELEVKRNAILLKIPNLPHPDVPVGKDESENKVIRSWGKPAEFDFKPKDHLELGERLGIIDMERAAKVAGARFSYLKGGAALLEVALIKFTFDTLTNEKVLKKIANSVAKGYSFKPFIPVFPPVMIRPDVFTKMARLSEADKDERYHLEKDDLYLIGSAEHTLGSMHADEVFGESDMPIRYIGFSTSFRREAGSYGKDTHGILRVHQFDKLEMESFTMPEDSLKEQEFIVAIQEYLMRQLKIPYEVVMICTGDMGGPDARQIDINAWMPGHPSTGSGWGTYRETHTSDMMTDYQTRRLNTKIKRSDGKIEFAHTNDATAFAIGRTLIAIIENYQTKDGKVNIPKVLQKYVGKKIIS